MLFSFFLFFICFLLQFPLLCAPQSFFPVFVLSLSSLSSLVLTRSSVSLRSNKGITILLFWFVLLGCSLVVIPFILGNIVPLHLDRAFPGLYVYSKLSYELCTKILKANNRFQIKIMGPHLGLFSKHGRKNLAYGTHILYMFY